jgi:hypothetical protein
MRHGAVQQGTDNRTVSFRYHRRREHDILTEPQYLIVKHYKVVYDSAFRGSMTRFEAAQP